MPFRRTVSVDDNLNSLLMKIRGEFISRGIDVDFTRSLNMLLALGIQRFYERPWNDATTELVVAYVLNERLKWEAILDDLVNEAIKLIPSVVNQLLQTVKASLPEQQKEKPP